MDAFKKQLEIIQSEGLDFVNPKEFDKNLHLRKKDRKILLTIDDAFSIFL